MYELWLSVCLGKNAMNFKREVFFFFFSETGWGEKMEEGRDER